MFDKRLIQEIPKAKAFVMRQVFYQWLALLTNMIFTMGLCFVFVKLFQQQLQISHMVYCLMVAVLLFVIRGFVLKKSTQCSFEAASLVKRTLRKRLFDKVLSLGGHYQDYVATSELVQLSVEGINQLETYFALYLPQLFYSVLAPLTLFVTMSFFDLKSAIVLLICVPLIPLSIVFVQKFAKRLLAKYWKSYTTLGDSFLENLQGLTTLKIYQSDAYKQEQMNQEAENFRKVTMRVLIMQLNSISVMDIVAYGGAGLGSYFAVMHYMNHEISLYAGLLIVLLSFEFFIPLRQLGSFFHIAMNGIAASEKIFRIFDIQDEVKGTEKLKDQPLDIQVQHLSFQYQEDRQIIKDISFTVAPHQFVAIVGKSGSGKSTIAKLIMGYHRYEGDLLIQNQQRSCLSDQNFYERCLYITHDPMIFKGTLRDNIDMLHVYHDDEIWEALRKVCLDQYFLGQNGLDTHILEAGSNLSGGQKQRLNLARALLRDGELYIFDEATSQIDIESENMILDVIHELSQTKTVLFITHRLSTVQECDRILVMSEGRIVESGQHDELMRNQGVYYELLKQQEELEVYQNETIDK